MVCNLKKVTDHRIVVKCTVYKFTIVQIFVESERVYNDNDKFRKKANSNYELTINFPKQETRTPVTGFEPTISRSVK